ncbi:sugar ABC transporter permease [Paenibacillus sp. IB182496]|uniref:Sugar ABC transporter permease n=1 Tax=Paenibacillus sabuli TaxID=2772509 RepID=A0A927GU74_9BACL|nr:sugar ABC transporter permease [Paenibacillus sabuli]MBD2848373.1 sugar ABC transporter permease [Paenibacillus sabuli]
MKALSSRKFIIMGLLPAIAVYAIFVFVPVVWSGYYGFFNWSGIGAARFIGFDNYTEIFRDPIFWTALRNNIIFVLASVFGQIPIALIVAILVQKDGKRSWFMRTAVFMPMVLSTVVIGMIWQYIYHPQIGILNFLLEWLGLESWQRVWLSEDYGIYALIPPLIWSFVGLYLIIFIAALQNIPGEIHDAAQLDGATGVRKIVAVTLPMIKGTILVAVVLCISGSLKSFDLVYIMTRGGPAHATELLATYMYNSTFTSYRYGFGSAISTTIVLVSLVLIGISQWLMSIKSKSNQ